MENGAEDKYKEVILIDNMVKSLKLNFFNNMNRYNLDTLKEIRVLLEKLSESKN